ncbi:MAG: flagellar biosynthetic protein FliR [Gammaproteobacteria bacterium]|nr:flagellar biosynthetic protein FliR [Gammaproteobacteria bacterium]
MNLAATEITAWIAGYMWPFFRIGAMLMAAPISGAQTVPVRARLVLAVALTLIIAPIVPRGPLVELFSYEWVMIIIYQILIGVVIGFVFQLIFAAVITGGQIIAMQMGLGFASMVDPQNGQQVPVLSQLYLMMTTLLFLAMDGHLIMIKVIADSFTILPIGMQGIDVDAFYKLATWGSDLFAAALWLALPAVASLLLINFSFGVMSRAAPQLQIFSIGFPITLMMGFVVIYFTLPGVVLQFSTLVNELVALLNYVLGGV